MTTIINTPGNEKGWDSWFGLIIGITVLFVAILLAYFYVLPAVVNNNPQKDINIDVKIPVEWPIKNPIPSTDPLPKAITPWDATP